MPEKASQGMYPLRAPYGYINITENSRSIIKINPDTSCFVKALFELCMPLATILYLNSRRKWLLMAWSIKAENHCTLAKTIEGIIKNELYMGSFRWKGVLLYRNASHESLVSKELFDKVQRIMHRPYKG